MLVKDTELYQEGVKKLEKIKSRSLLKVDIKKDKPHKTFIGRLIHNIIKN